MLSALQLAATLALASVVPEAPAGPSGAGSSLLQPVSPEEAARLRRECCRVLLELSDGSAVRGTLSEYSGKDGYFRVATDPRKPAYIERFAAEEVRAVELLGEAQAGAIENQDEIRRKFQVELDAAAREIQNAAGDGTLDALVRERETRLTSLRLDQGRLLLDRVKVHRDAVWLMRAYCEQAGGATDRESQARAMERLQKLDFVDRTVRTIVMRMGELSFRSPDGRRGHGGVGPGLRRPD